MSKSYELVGSVMMIKNTEQITDTFKKREVILKIDPESQYPQEVKLQTTQDKTKLLDDVRVGDIISVSFNLQGKGYEKKDGSGRDAITNLNIWKLERIQGTMTDAGQKFDAADQNRTAQPAGDFDDIPF